VGGRRLLLPRAREIACQRQVRARSSPLNGIISGTPLAAVIPVLATNPSPTDALPTARPQGQGDRHEVPAA
jgi:hypothetical protein